jgi:hypothetical protein
MYITPSWLDSTNRTPEQLVECPVECPEDSLEEDSLEEPLKEDKAHKLMKSTELIMIIYIFVKLFNFIYNFKKF